MPVNLRPYLGALLQARKRNAPASARPSGPVHPPPKKSFRGGSKNTVAPYLRKKTSPNRIRRKESHEQSYNRL